MIGDNILTAISVGRDSELVGPAQTVIRVDAELVSSDSYAQRLNVTYSLEEEGQKSNVSGDSRDSVSYKAPISSNFSTQSNFVKSVQERKYAFACDGRTFDLIRTHDRALLDRIVQRGKIFARMLPEQKIQLIECMKDLG